MKRIILMLALASPSAFAGNYATCLLDRMGRIQNDHAARAAMSVCRSEHPGGFEGVEQGAGRGFFGFSSGDECTLKRGATTENRIAAYQIRLACSKLYNEPLGLFDDLLPRPVK